jgi:hypothetical protein
VGNPTYPRGSHRQRDTDHPIGCGIGAEASPRADATFRSHSLPSLWRLLFKTGFGAKV